MAVVTRSIEMIKQTLSEIKDGYFAYVKTNPESIYQIEKSLKTFSYAIEFLPRDYENTVYLTEILGAANNLFSYLNDCIIRGSRRLALQDHHIIVDQIKRWIMLVEFTQTFIEISAKRLGGNGARWAVIAIISIVKAVLRLILLYGYNSGIQTHPYIKPIDKERLSQQKEQEQATTSEPYVYNGPRSGLRMRTLASSVPLHERTWKVPDDSVTVAPDDDTESSTKLNQHQRTGEALHIIRPLIHLTSVAFFGTKSIIPWLVSLTTDASSHTLISGQVPIRKNTKSILNATERKELQRRVLVMFLYVLRSPVYDRYTKTRILNTLRILSDNVPLVRFVLQPLAKYLPVWQQYYFYSWME